MPPESVGPNIPENDKEQYVPIFKSQPFAPCLCIKCYSSLKVQIVIANDVESNLLKSLWIKWDNWDSYFNSIAIFIIYPSLPFPFDSPVLFTAIIPGQET